MVTILRNHLVKWTALIYLTYISIQIPWLKCNQTNCQDWHYYGVLQNLTLIYMMSGCSLKDFFLTLVEHLSNICLQMQIFLLAHNLKQPLWSAWKGYNQWPMMKRSSWYVWSWNFGPDKMRQKNWIKQAVALKHCWRGINNKELLQTQHTWTSSSFQFLAMLLRDFSEM